MVGNDTRHDRMGNTETDSKSMNLLCCTLPYLLLHFADALGISTYRQWSCICIRTNVCCTVLYTKVRQKRIDTLLLPLLATI